MAKIYDALRKAEAERQRKVGTSSGPERLDWEPESAEAAKPASTVKLPGGPRSESRKQSNDGGGDINKRRIALLQPDSYVAEQFRALRGRLDALRTCDLPPTEREGTLGLSLELACALVPVKWSSPGLSWTS